MTYTAAYPGHPRGAEYLDRDETAVYDAIRSLSACGRTTNSSQVARATLIPRTTLRAVLAQLDARGFIRNVSTGAAYHWRVTGQPVPYPVETRERDRELARRQRELNADIERQRSHP
jgi:hypothetical protein